MKKIDKTTIDNIKVGVFAIIFWYAIVMFIFRAFLEVSVYFVRSFSITLTLIFLGAAIFTAFTIVLDKRIKFLALLHKKKALARILFFTSTGVMLIYFMSNIIA